MGHPDFQDYSNWRGPVLAAGSPIVTTVAQYQVNGYVTNFASLFVSIGTAFNNGGVVDISFYTDTTRAVKTGNFSWQLWDTAVQVFIPVTGNFAELTITTANAGNQQFNVFVGPSNVSVPRATYTAAFNQIEAVSLSVPASTTSFFQVPQTQTGLVYVSLMPNDTTGKLNFSLFELDDTGTAQGALIKHPGFTTDAYLSTACGERVLQAQIQNTDGVSAHVLAYRVRVQSQ